MSGKHTKFESSSDEEEERKSQKKEKVNEKRDKKEKRDRSRSREDDRRDRSDDKSKYSRRDTERYDRDPGRRNDHHRPRDWQESRRGHGEFRNREFRQNNKKFDKPWDNRVNTEKVAEQKKLLWGSKKTEDSEVNAEPSTSEEASTASALPKNAKLWSSAIAATGVDGSQANKFMRLMGVKNASAAGADDAQLDEEKYRQQKLLGDLDKQYAMARESTHKGRGMGLGFHH